MDEKRSRWPYLTPFFSVILRRVYFSKTVSELLLTVCRSHHSLISKHGNVSSSKYFILFSSFLACKVKSINIYWCVKSILWNPLQYSGSFFMCKKLLFIHEFLTKILDGGQSGTPKIYVLWTRLVPWNKRNNIILFGLIWKYYILLASVLLSLFAEYTNGHRSRLLQRKVVSKYSLCRSRAVK